MRNKNLLILTTEMALILLFLVSCTANAKLTNVPMIPAKTIEPTNTVVLQIPTETEFVSPTNTVPYPTTTPFPIPAGKLAFSDGSPNLDGSLKILDIKSNRVTKIVGARQKIDGVEISLFSPSITWSPDGHWIAFVAEDIRANKWIYAYYDIYIAKSDGSQIKRLTFSPSHAKSSISWSPDGKYILTNMDGETGISDIYLINAKNGEISRRLTVSTNNGMNKSKWSPDGKRIAFTFGNRLFIMDADGKNRKLLKDFSPGYPMMLSWSDDGSKIILGVDNKINGHCSNMFAINPDGSDFSQITNNAGYNYSPSWSDGKFFIFSGTSFICDTIPKSGNIYISDIRGNTQELLLNIDANSSIAWSPLPALVIGNNYAITELSDNLNLHSSASLTSDVLKKLKVGDIFTILDGPVDTDDYYWWKIRTTDGTEGWIVEMAYWYKLLNP